MRIERRELLRAGAGLLAAPFVNRGRCRLEAAPHRTYSTRAIGLVERSVVIDMLGLPTMDWAKLDLWFSTPGAFTEADLRKLRGSGITVFHAAVGFPAADPAQASELWLTHWGGFIRRHSQYFSVVECKDDIVRAKAAGKIGILCGLQDSGHFHNTDDIIRYLSLGQRVSQLTYNSRNALGCGCIDRPDDGLTEFGERVVEGMNKTGMAVDVSHAGDRTSIDACKASRKPVLITHSNCRALTPHPRCKPDQVIRSMALTGGVLGITGLSPFVGRRATLENVLDHFDHVTHLVGVEHVGLGSDTDLDGRRNHIDVSGLNHPQRVYDLTEGLIRRRYTDAQIELILGGNFLRVLDSIWTLTSET